MSVSNPSTVGAEAGGLEVQGHNLVRPCFKVKKAEDLARVKDLGLTSSNEEIKKKIKSDPGIENIATYFQPLHHLTRNVSLFGTPTVPRDSVYHSPLCVTVICINVVCPACPAQPRNQQGSGRASGQEKHRVEQSLLCLVSHGKQEDRLRNFMRTGRMAAGRIWVEGRSARGGPEPSSC